MADTKLLGILERIYEGDASAADELARAWSEPLDVRVGKLSRDNQKRVEILLEAVFEECKGRRHSPRHFLKRLNEVTSLVTGMERILGT